MCNASVKIINPPIYLFLYPFYGEAFQTIAELSQVTQPVHFDSKALLVCEVWRRNWSCCPKRNRICDKSVISSLKAENNLWDIKNIWNKSRSKKRNKEKESRKGGRGK